MFLVIIFAFALLYSARANTVYHPDILFKQHITINNKLLSKILIPKVSPYDKKKYINLYRNKMTVMGLFFYILSALFITLILMLVYSVEPIPIDPIVIDNKYLQLAIDTLNFSLSYKLAFLLFLAEWSVFFMNMSNVIANNGEKDTEKLYIILAFISAIGLLILLFFTFPDFITLLQTDY